MSRLTSRQESQIFEASQAGIAPARIAELIGCTERQVTEVIADYRRILAEQDAWTQTVKIESFGKEGVDWKHNVLKDAWRDKARNALKGEP